MISKSASIVLLTASLVIGGCATSGGTRTKTPGETARPSGETHPLKQWVNDQPRARKKALIGALAGATVGAATAALTGHDPWRGAAAGAIAGAISGFVVGKRQDTLFASRDEAARRIGYDASQGYVMRIDEVSLDPADPRAGDEVELYVRYVVIGPDPQETLSVSSFTGIKYDGEYVKVDPHDGFRVERGGGIVESRVRLTLPARAPSGTYAIETLLEDPSGRFSDSGESPLYLG